MGLRKSVTEALELPKEIMLDLPLITLTGREEITVENYKGILEYNEETVRVGTAEGVLCLTGSGLCLRQLSADCIIVAGRIEGLRFLV